MQAQSQKRSLVLASSSPYRKLLLERLGLPFEVCSPGIDEIPAADETAPQLVTRLADEKALAVAQRFPAAVVIGCDQVAIHRGRVVGKPGTAARARLQLASFSGSQVDFLSALAVRCLESGFHCATTVVTEVVLSVVGPIPRTLTPVGILKLLRLGGKVSGPNSVDVAGMFTIPPS